jgi:glutamine amidotransferase
MSCKIVIIDYGMGNLGSIQNMLSRIGVESVISSDAEVMKAADKLVLPGVGAFDNAIMNLNGLQLVEVLDRLVLNEKVPILGICLGMQLFSARSEEGQLPGLGWIDAETVRFRFEEGNGQLRIPHMGWNTVNVNQKRSIFNDMYDDSRFYFVHSYHVKCNDMANVLSTTSYGMEFHSAVIKGNIVGTQFHPEKSHKYGIRLLQNFVGLER